MLQDRDGQQLPDWSQRHQLFAVGDDDLDQADDVAKQQYLQVNDDHFAGAKNGAASA